jgi:hypothetical protein
VRGWRPVKFFDKGVDESGGVRQGVVKAYIREISVVVNLRDEVRHTTQHDFDISGRGGPRQIRLGDFRGSCA